MATKLVDAVGVLRKRFPAQRQGDCGLFSFYYAAHLIQQVHGSVGYSVLSVDPPRKRYHAAKAVAPGVPNPKGFQAFSNPALTPRDRHTLTASIRKFAKTDFSSAQGEVLLQEEMQAIIDHYGYGSKVSTSSDPDLLKNFIGNSLRQDRPILIPYCVGDGGDPVDHDKEPGAHWSVIYDMVGDECHFINPWNPVTERHAKTDMFVASNAYVDDMKYEPIWEKQARAAITGTVADLGSKTTGTKYSKTSETTVPVGKEATHRPLYPGTRDQKLKHLVFSVFASDEQIKAMTPPPVPSRATRPALT